MATYQHLPIYRTTYDLLVKVTDATRHYPRDFKRSLGDAIRDEVMLIVLMIYRANSSRSALRSSCIEEILERLQVTELMLRLSRDMGMLSIKRFSSIVQLTDDLGKQAVGWRKATVSAG